MTVPHLHQLSLLADLQPPYATPHRYLCNLCQEYGNGPAYHCEHCHFYLHPHCAATSTVQDHISHSQHLLHRCLMTNACHACNSCGLHVYGTTYRCDLCDFDLHPTCARAPRFIVQANQIHKHPLALIRFPKYASRLHCAACKLRLHHQCYACTVCPDYHIHQYCATVSSKILQHPDHPRHTLALVTGSPPPKGLSTPARRCMRCHQDVLGWHFHCQDCNFSLHPGCTKIVHEIPDSSAPKEPDEESDTCPICWEGFGTEQSPKKSTSCGHHFHLDCILDWMDRSPLCPICRSEVRIQL